MDDTQIDVHDAAAGDAFARALWRIYRRPDPPPLWQGGGNLPWNDPAFSERMLREHLDESHGAASRQAAERAAQLEWLWAQLHLEPGQRVVSKGAYLIRLSTSKAGPSGHAH